MKNATKILALIATLSLTCAVMAKDPTTKPAGLRGKVQSVDGMIITIKNKGGEVTITTDANTTFTLDGKTATDDGKPFTIADVKAGERVVSATPTDGVAAQVKLTSGGKKKKNQEPTTAPAAN